MIHEQLIKTVYNQCQRLSDTEISENLHLLSVNYNEKCPFNICAQSSEANEALNRIESVTFDDEDRKYYNMILKRKPISYDFNPSNRKRAEAILAVISAI